MLYMQQQVALVINAVIIMQICTYIHVHPPIQILANLRLVACKQQSAHMRFTKFGCRRRRLPHIPLHANIFIYRHMCTCAYKICNYLRVILIYCWFDQLTRLPPSLAAICHRYAGIHICTYIWVCYVVWNFKHNVIVNLNLPN